jgi:hypothetical protein
MWAYTGKEVVECKVLMAVVEVPKDQVRWLRLRAGYSERGFCVERALLPATPEATARTLPVK